MTGLTCRSPMLPCCTGRTRSATRAVSVASGLHGDPVFRSPASLRLGIAACCSATAVRHRYAVAAGPLPAAASLRAASALAAAADGHLRRGAASDPAPATAAGAASAAGAGRGPAAARDWPAASAPPGASALAAAEAAGSPVAPRAGPVLSGSGSRWPTGLDRDGLAYYPRSGASAAAAAVAGTPRPGDGVLQPAARHDPGCRGAGTGDGAADIAVRPDTLGAGGSVAVRAAK